jgi:predicted DNA binding CopG/RHH family protein
MSDHRSTDAELAEEARKWDNRELTPHEWADAPDAAPRAKETVSISIRLPKRMVGILKEFARRTGVGYQVLMKRWLDERIALEHRKIKERIAESERIKAAERQQRAVIVMPRLWSQAASFVGHSIPHPNPNAPDQSPAPAGG